MKHLTNLSVPKGTIKSRINQAILAFLQSNGPTSEADLETRFRNMALASGRGAPGWVNRRMKYLQAEGFATRKPSSDGTVYWTADPNQAAPEPEPDFANVAQPRRMSMFGPVYRPTTTAMRPGAMDYAAVPSLHMGKRHTFRSGM
ncbi:MAG: hypothetical protein AB7P37_21160 [Ramlibacter sp.]